MFLSWALIFAIEWVQFEQRVHFYTRTLESARDGWIFIRQSTLDTLDRLMGIIEHILDR
jgi:hypothetical protein